MSHASLANNGTAGPLKQVEIGVMAAVFVLLSALAHGLVLGPGPPARGG